MAETLKVNNDVAESSPVPAGFFTEESAGHFSGSGYIRVRDMPTRWMKKIPRLILNEMVTGAESYVKMDSPQMSQPPERSSE